MDGIAVSCGVGHRHGSDPVSLWLWCRLAAAAPIRPLPWELPYATCAALKSQKKKKRKRKILRSSVKTLGRKWLWRDRIKKDWNAPSLIIAANYNQLLNNLQQNKTANYQKRYPAPEDKEEAALGQCQEQLGDISYPNPAGWGAYRLVSNYHRGSAWK